MKQRFQRREMPSDAQVISHAVACRPAQAHVGAHSYLPLAKRVIESKRHYARIRKLSSRNVSSSSLWIGVNLVVTKLRGRPS